MHEGAGDHHPLDLTARKVVGAAVGPVGQSELGQQLVGQGHPSRPWHPVIAGVEQEVLTHGQGAVEVVGLRDDTEHSSCSDRIADHINAGHGGAAVVGRTLVVRIPMVVVLPAPLGAQEAEDFAVSDGEGDTGQGVLRRLG